MYHIRRTNSPVLVESGDGKIPREDWVILIAIPGEAERGKGHLAELPSLKSNHPCIFPGAWKVFHQIRAF
jgi:hypothetical protein